VFGQIDFARSSAGPASFPAGTTLTFLPFARDGITFAYFDHGSNELNNLTTAQLQALYGTGNVSTTGIITLGNGHTVAACMVQSGSGTGKFWDKAMGNAGNGTTAHASAVASGCNASVDYEENGANSWLASTFISTLPATEDAVIPFSAGQWIAQLNQASLDRTSTGCTGGVGLGQIDGVNPRVATNPSCTTGQALNATYYANLTYGRDLYIVVPTSKLGVPGDPGLKSLFLGSGSAICSAAAGTTIQNFGFSTATAAACGSTGQTSGLNPN
jgi:hypothetical protein